MTSTPGVGPRGRVLLNNSASPGGGGGADTPHPPPPLRPCLPPSYVIGQNFLRVFSQSKIFSGAFGANPFRPKNFFAASNNSGSPEGGAGAGGGDTAPTTHPPWTPPPLSGKLCLRAAPAGRAWHRTPPYKFWVVGLRGWQVDCGRNWGAYRSFRLASPLNCE